MFMKHTKQSFKRATTALCLAWLPTASVWATGAPDAGAIQQHMERTVKQPASSVVPAAKSVPAQAPQPGQQVVTVTQFEFVGNTLLSSNALTELTQGLLNKPLSLAELRGVSEQVQQAYSAAGWMVHVYLPAQEIDGGKVKVQVVEASLGKLVLTGDAPRVSQARLESIVSGQLKPGAPIRTAQLERALLLLSDTPGVLTTANFMQGQQAGQTDLVVNVSNKPAVSGSAAVDNMGSKLTGTERLSATVNVASPMGWGDLVTISGLKTSGSGFVRSAYSVPLGSDGWRVGVHASSMNYQTLAPNNFSGKASTYGLDGSYPILRSPTRSLYLTAAWDQKAFRNDAGELAVSDYRIQVANVMLSGNAQDAWAGGGINSMTLGLVEGNVSPAPLLADASTQGQFRKLQLNVSRVQTITSSLSGNVSWQMQRANKSLDGSEKLYLGGAYGVRGYPMSEAAAKEGESLSLELTQQLPKDVTVSGFYDWGHARNPEATEASLRQYSIRGYGASLTWQAANQMQIKATAARRLGDNPLPGATYSANRLWLSANYSF